MSAPAVSRGCGAVFYRARAPAPPPPPPPAAVRPWTGRRTLFSGAAPETKLYGERRLLGFSAPQIFSVVSAVDRYHSFVPWCKKSVVTRRFGEDGLVADLVIGFPPFVGESYTSRVTLFRPHLVTSVCEDMRLFEHLRSVWKFSPRSEHSCQVDFAVSFRFKSAAHSLISKLFFDEVIRQNVGAFLRETERRFGPESIPRQRPVVYAKR